MKVLAAFLLFALALPVIAQSPPPSKPWVYGPSTQWDPSWNNWPNPHKGACFYSTAPFRGNHFCVRSGDRLPSLPGNFGGNISSVVTFGGASVKVFNDRNFQNGSTVLRGNVPDLRNVPFRGGHTWNNRISSLIVY